jgi:hypothetical protein
VKKKIWGRAFSEFLEARRFDRTYYLAMSPQERLETVQILRERAHKIDKGLGHEGRKRLRRIIRIIQQA